MQPSKINYAEAASKEYGTFIRLVDFKADLPEIHRWWEAHGWPKIPANLLPKTGVISIQNNKPVAAGFLYKTDSDIAWLEYIISSPESDYKQRRIAVHSIVGELVRLAKEAGFKVIWTVTDNKSLQGRYLDQGFVVGDENTTAFIRRIE